MMFSEMKARGLYPPNYFVHHESVIPTVTVRLLNEQRPAIWEQVSSFVDRNGSIANRDLRKIADLETLQATRMLKGWVEKGILVSQEVAKKYELSKETNDLAQNDLLSFGENPLNAALDSAIDEQVLNSIDQLPQ
jgi:ATP-dependent DNA helicase RecG